MYHISSGRLGFEHLPASFVPPPLPPVHAGVTCDGRLSCWGRELRGTRNKCLQCYNVDLCAACAPLHAHTGHMLALIPQPVHPASLGVLNALTRPIALGLQGQSLSDAAPAGRAEQLEARLYPQAPVPLEAQRAESLGLEAARVDALRALHTGAPSHNAAVTRAGVLDPRFFCLVGADFVRMGGASEVALPAAAPLPFSFVAAPEHALQAYYTLHDTLLLMDRARGFPVAALQVLPAPAPGGAASALRMQGPTGSSSGEGGALLTLVAAYSSRPADAAFVLTNLLPDEELVFFLRACSSAGACAQQGHVNAGRETVAAGQSLECLVPLAAQLGPLFRLDVHAHTDGRGMGDTVPAASLAAPGNFAWETSDHFLRRMGDPARSASTANGGFVGFSLPATSAPPLWGFPGSSAGAAGCGNGGGLGGSAMPPTGFGFGCFRVPFPSAAARPAERAYSPTPLAASALLLHLQARELAVAARGPHASYAAALPQLIERVRTAREGGVAAPLPPLLPPALLAPSAQRTSTCLQCQATGAELAQRPLDCVLLPCGHRVAHYDEPAGYDVCPICRCAVSARLQE